MATNITATKTPTKDLHDVLGRVEKVFFNTTPDNGDTALSGLTGSFDFKLPILDESVTFNMGDADVTRIKLIDQTNWTSYAKKGDPDISFQVPSLSRDIADILGNKMGTESDKSSTLGMKLQGYTATPKKVSGSLLFVSDDEQVCVYLPNVEIFATPVLGDGDNPSYFNCVITPIPDSTGADYYIGIKTSTEAGA